MKHLLTLLLAVLCMSMVSMHDLQKDNREEAKRLVQSTQIMIFNDKTDSLILILDHAIQLDSSLWEAYSGKAFLLDIAGRQSEALHMLEQLERDGRFANQSCLLFHLGDHYYCANDTPRGKEKFRQALSIDEARFAEHPCDSLITWLAYGYRRLYDGKTARKKCMALFKKSPITSRKARKEAIQEVCTWASIGEGQIGACLDPYKFYQFVDKQKKEHLQRTKVKTKHKIGSKRH